MLARRGAVPFGIEQAAMNVADRIPASQQGRRSAPATQSDELASTKLQAIDKGPLCGPWIIESSGELHRTQGGQALLVGDDASQPESNVQ